MPSLQTKAMQISGFHECMFGTRLQLSLLDTAVFVKLYKVD